MLLLFFISFTILLSTEMIIDASDWNDWVYLNLSIGSIVNPGTESEAENSLGWDLAFRRYNIRTNSGLSGNGNGGAYIDSINTWNSDSYESLSEVPEASFFVRDTTIDTYYNLELHQYFQGIANPALETWQELDINNEYQLSYTNNQFIIRTALGDKFYKFWATNYYDQFGTSGFVTIKFDEINPCALGHDGCGECGGDNSSCMGCLDGGDTEDGDNIEACNYNPGLFIDPLAINFSQDDGSCEYEFEEGCNSCDCASIEESLTPHNFSLSQNYPNPFNPITNILFTIPYSDYVSLIIYDLKGSIITTLVDSYLFSGEYSFRWDASESNIPISSGVYLYQLKFGTSIINQKMLLLK